MAEGLEGLAEEPKAEIHIDLLRTTLKKLKFENTRPYNGIHGFWFKEFTSILDRQALDMNRCLQEAHVSEWMTKGKKTLIQKDPLKGTTLNNYRPITCLPMMWKILTAQIREGIYYSLTSRGCSLRNRKNAAEDLEAQESYSTLISTSSTRSRRDGKIYLWPGLITKRLMIWSHKTG